MTSLLQPRSVTSQLAIHTQRLPSLIGAAVVLVVLSTRLVATTGEASTPDCWVTGDLAGDGDPMQVYTALCSPTASVPHAEANA